MIGIYKITNLKNNHCYVGQSKDICKRWKEHISSSFNTKRKEYAFPLCEAIRKYGVDSFCFETLEICSMEQLTERELYYYNILTPAYNQTVPSENPMAKKEVKQKHDTNCKDNGKHKNSRENLKLNRAKTPIKAIRIDTGDEVFFNSLWEAERILNIPRSSIHQALNPNHPRKTSGGYTFKRCQKKA